MFSWFKRSKLGSHQPLDTAKLQPDRDKIGRPLRPILLGFTDRQEATIQQRLLALQWAKEWTGNGLLTIPIEQLLEALANVLGGKPMKANDPAHPVISHAVRALALSAQETRAERTRDAFPWLELRLGAQEQPCNAAKRRVDQPVNWDEIPRIPLPDCDVSECKCWIRQVTKGEFHRVYQQGARSE